MTTLTLPRCGDIGPNPREYEFEPIPETAPATEPIAVPAPAEPVKEPAHV